MKPPDPEIREFASAWLAKALVDLLVCDSLIAQDARLWESVTFHCRQAVEKALKAVLVWHQVEFPKTYDLQRLLDLLADADPEVVGRSAEAVGLTPTASSTATRESIRRSIRRRRSPLSRWLVYAAAAERIGSV